MNNSLRFFLKFINKLCIVYIFFAVAMLFFLILDEGFDGIDFSMKRFFFVFGIPALIFFLTKYLVNGSN